MAQLRTVVFIDGQNFKKNLQTFSFQTPDSTNQYRLDEKHFLWNDFFPAIVKEFDSDSVQHLLIRTYWYNADGVTSWREDERRINDTLRDLALKGHNVSRETLVTLAKGWWEREREYVRTVREDLFPSIQREVDLLEFRYLGLYRLDPFRVHSFEPPDRYNGTRVGEKGVDLGIAVDMVAKMSGYDAAILLSGDADFMPVVQYLKDNLKYVYQFSLAKGVPPKIGYLSDALKVHVDRFQHFDEHQLLTNFLNRSAKIPPLVLRAIDDRIADLAKLRQ